MPVRPRFTPGVSHTPGQRQFTDREDFVAAFERALAAPRCRHPLVLAFYGVGGIGKTTLRRHLAERLAEQVNVVSAAVDFDVPAHRDQENALFVLRKVLRSRSKVSFPSFDIAFAVYWQKTRPQTPLAKATFPLFEESDMVGEVLSAMGNIPFLGALPKLPALIARGSKVLQDWWTRRGSVELQDLAHLEASQVAERLPMFWAADLREHLAGWGRQAVIFLDTYEALTETERSTGKTHSQDAWVRELVAQLPEVLWVVCGREMLRWTELDPDWGECLSQHLVGGLAEADAQQFLESCGVAELEIRDAIVEGSDGLPYYLDLAVDTYSEIARAGTRPGPADFARAPGEVLVRFLRHLTQSEVETLKVLSVPRYWDRALFELLVGRFGTGYPLTAYDYLCRFSFIAEGEVEGTWKMHQLMRASLQEHLDVELKTQLHRVLFDHYTARLARVDPKDITDQDRFALAEAFHHGSVVMPPVELGAWLDQAAAPFARAAYWRLLVPLYESLARLPAGDAGSTAAAVTALVALARCQRSLGRYAEADAACARAMAQQDAAPARDPMLLARVLAELADLRHAQGRYDDEEPLLRQGLEMLRTELGPIHELVADSLYALAVLCGRQGRNAEASQFSREALAIREQVLGPGHPKVAESLSLEALACWARAEHVEAEALQRRALAIIEAALGPDNPAVSAALNNLAAVLWRQGRFRDAEGPYRRALAIREHRLGTEHPETMDSATWLAILLKDMGRYGEAEELFRRSLAAREAVLGAEHPGIAQALNGLASLCHETGRLEEAEAHYRRALAIRAGKFGEAHPTTAQTLNGLGLVLRDSGRLEEAEEHLRRGLAARERVQGVDHPDVTPHLNALGSLFLRRGRLADARILLTRALDIAERRLGPDHPNVGESLCYLGLLKLQEGDLKSAEELARRALAIWERKLEPGHFVLSNLLEGLAGICEQTGRAAEARELRERLARRG